MNEPTIKFTRWLDKNPETGEKVGPGEISEEIELPAKYVVCGKCRGHGRHLNDTIRTHAYSEEDMREDPEFFEEYRKGGFGTYGVECTECQGEKVVKAVDRNRVKKALLKEYDKYVDEQERQAASELATYRMEMGIWD
jgi:hypothetical protein